MPTAVYDKPGTLTAHAPVGDSATTSRQTTLYDLISALQATVDAYEDDLVISLVSRCMEHGDITWLGDVDGIRAIIKELGCAA